MEIIDLINTFVKILIITFFVYLIYGKITNCKIKNINYIIVFAVSVIISTIYIIINKFLPPLISIIILYLSYGGIIYKIEKKRLNFAAYIYSCIISYIIYLLSIIIAAITLFVISDSREHTNPIILLLIAFINSVLFFFIFKIKRFKNGFNFFKDTRRNNIINVFTVFLTGLIFLIFGILQRDTTWGMSLYMLFGSVFVMVALIIWIKSQITKTYKNKMRDRTIEIQKTEINEKSKMIEEIKNENLKLATAVHKYNHKFEALELAMKNALSLESKTEFANELSVILKEAEETSKNFAEATEVTMAKLPETNIPGIDNMFKYMQKEARKNNINFDLKINTTINPLIDNIIPKEKFEILIGDHLKDAIIAVNSSEKSYKSILVILGLVDGVYELSIYDTGIEFEIDTLLKLGKEQVTTHKETGGSGIGFMTTFETLKECKASLVIEEYNPETTSYTKSVTIRFDGKNKYKISSYRAEKIKEQKHKRRIIIEKLK